MTSHHNDQPPAKETTLTRAYDRDRARAYAAGWTAFFSMAVTSMSFQVYHAITVGHMPWYLAYPDGIGPLLISICILEVASFWTDAPSWYKPGAYLVMAGSMYWSAAAVSNVVFPTAPPHMSLLFGLLMDGAALLAVHFLLNGPRKAVAEEAVDWPPLTVPAGTPQAAPAAPVMASSSGMSQAIREATGVPLDKPLDKPAGEPASQPLDVPVSEPPDVPVDRPAREPAGRPATPRARAGAIPMDADSKRARKLYRDSVEAGEPLTDRKLAAKFPGRGRTWASNRIAECQDGPQLAAGGAG